MQVYSYAQEGYQGSIVLVEVDVRRGLPGTTIVGLPGGAVREARDRVRVAIRNSGYTYPAERVVINLSPAALPKSGASFDLALAFAMLVVTEQIPCHASESILVIGELHLDGSVRAVTGSIAAITEAAALHIHSYLVPRPNQREAQLIEQGTVHAIAHLRDLHSLLSLAPPASNSSSVKVSSVSMPDSRLSESQKAESVRQLLKFGNLEPFNLSLLRGQAVLKRALEIAAAGGHHILLVGPPGSGKTLAARCLGSLMPSLTIDEAIEVTRIFTLTETLPTSLGLIRLAPFRAPHHSISYAGMVGGGALVTPGEIVRAHCGLLLLDEVLEFRRDVLQSLRQPLEEGQVRIARSERVAYFPCEFQLVMTANMCPCGNLGHRNATCLCKFDEIRKYWKRLGGAFLDRIPIRVHVSAQYNDIVSDHNYMTSEDVLARVQQARHYQRRRYNGTGIRSNGRLSVEAIQRYCLLSTRLSHILQRAAEKFQFSLRTVSMIQVLSRTIADLEASESIKEEHLLEAIQHRRLLSADDGYTTTSTIAQFLS